MLLPLIVSAIIIEKREKSINKQRTCKQLITIWRHRKADTIASIFSFFAVDIIFRRNERNKGAVRLTDLGLGLIEYFCHGVVGPRNMFFSTHWQMAVKKGTIEVYRFHAILEPGTTLKKLSKNLAIGSQKYTPSWVHWAIKQKNLLGKSIFIEFLRFEKKIIGCCKNQFGVVVFAGLSLFSGTR